ncbi:T9SS sorting signal type C domain-containing protein [Flavobacterium piscisymbiosum]|uniref:T9SS sorting signal type C domain-containing protein n=1 Tax=Flavobacterium piscisymbiosum TaxID=2893753 RepID=A0ABS8M9W6_9FLAO|nr:T9SS sorting signal type C domain-containing protein [Flavobacterium sp. F-30]MCC9062229.1 T9SS sorting signal type C domain-containing protein [Flavobacterium sp. F-30]
MIKKVFIPFALILLFSNIDLRAQQGKLDVTFSIIDDGQKGDGFDNIVRTLCLQEDQKLIVGGDYLSLNGVSSPYLSRLMPDGTIDETFNIGIGFNGKIYSSYIQSDGKIIVGGSFTSFNGNNTGRLVRLNTDGSYDATFNTSIAASAGIIYDISPQADGKIIIVGSFTKYNNVTVNRIARVLPNGSLDTSFITGSGSSSNITSAKVLSDGKILLSGNFTSFNGSSINKIVRLFQDGSIDHNFNIGSGFNDDVNAMIIQSDQKIILGGKFTNYNGIGANRIIRINQDGSPDSNFLSGSGFSKDAVQTIKTDAVGNIMVGGSFIGSYNGTEINRLCFLNRDGTLKTDFDIGSGPGSASVLALATDREGSWYIGGSFSVFDNLNQGRLAKIDANGDHDAGYLAAGIGFDNSVLKVLSLENKKTMVFGSFTKFNGAYCSRITRVLEDGSSDVSFNRGEQGANNLVKNAVLQLDGKIVVGGNFTKYNEINSNRIVRIFPDGALDNSFVIGSGFNSQVYALDVQPDGKLIVAGNFTTYNGSAAGRIVRLLENGLRDTSFNIGLGADAIIETVLLQSDGKILVAGRFNTFNGLLYPRLVRLNTNGSIDTSFNIGTGFDRYVYALALQSDKKIILGGSFLTYNGTSQKRIARLNYDGSLDPTFNSDTGFNKGDVRTILVQPDDRILVGGTFSGTYKTSPSLRLIRLEKSGDYDPSFLASLNKELYSMSFTSDYKLIIGGGFNSVSGISKHRIARLKLCLDSTIWNGISWSNGFPSPAKEVIFKDNYPNLTTTDVCSCYVDEGKVVTVLSENTLGIEFSYLGLGNLILEDSASLYQSDDDIVNNGIAFVKRKSSPILKFDYTYWSSPVNNQRLVDVSPNTAPDMFFSYDYIVKWIQENPSTCNMIPGKGYIIRGPENFSQTITSNFEAIFKGAPNNGKIEAVLKTANSYVLVGNPYPSAINADVFMTNNRSKIKGALYFWTHNTPYTNNKYASDDYAVYNLLGGVGTREALSTGINESIPNGKIASGQAFFVTSKVAGTVEFNNSTRISGSNSRFFKHVEKNNEQGHKSTIEKHRIWLNLKNSEGAFKQILVGYIQGATNLYDDNYDAVSFNSNQFVDFYSIADSKKLVIQGRALPFVQTDSIVLGYKSSINGNFSFDIDHEDGLFENLNVFIEDKDLKQIHDLKESPYFFDTSVGTFNDRFILKYIDKTLNKTDFENFEDHIFIVVKDKMIKVISTKELIKEVSVFDLLGKLLYHKENVENAEHRLLNLVSQNQVLLVKVKLESGLIVTKKTIF